jgi:hypothetical protein
MLWIPLALCIALPTQHLSCYEQGEKMVQENEVSVPERLTQQDGEAIKKALLEAIYRSEDPSLHKLAAEVESATPFVDSTGTLYLKTWRLDRGRGRLIKRPLGVSEGPLFEADVSIVDGRWVVGGVTVGRMIRPR